MGHMQGMERAVSGRWLILATLSVCASLVLFALWQRSRDTARIREFWGANGAQLIQHAPRVAMRPGPPEVNDEPPSLESDRDWLDLSTAPGLIHLRATLVDDRYFLWPSREALGEERLASGPDFRVLRFSRGDDRSAEASADTVSADEVPAGEVPAAGQSTARFAQSGFIDVGIDLDGGAIVNLASGRAVDILPSSLQAIRAYLETQSPQ
jgi:hypothetical protein